ncbi:recombinase RecA [Candidatus Mycoplasma haematohominis]|uniref:Protein RecA n=1 Tax=Candidatus Mycoplasma haematohominis TaxID=1494318 RepID=A0A478FT95_9MOLU|nr:recombinase RecA [Candidatus Mycoplasma haemohominis]GCE63230.1 recombinase A [Candidatus Mycoplasma haemohominis]
MKKEDNKTKNLLKEIGVNFFKEVTSMKETKVNILPTHSYSLNRALGLGGFPEGKIIEIFGSDSSGKSTLALQTLAHTQKQKKTSVYLDLENTLNPEWAVKLGVDIDNLLIARPENGEKAFDLINKLLETKEVDLIIVDSVTALVPVYEFESRIEDQSMGLHARLMSKGLRIMQSLMIGNKTTVIFINQLREKIGANAYMPATVTTGGRALRYASCVRLEVKRTDSIKDANGRVLGFETKCIVVKNKYGVPLTTAKTFLYFDTGFDVYAEVINELIESKKILKKGSWLELDGKNLAQGMTQLRNKMMKDPALAETLKKLAFPED